MFGPVVLGLFFIVLTLTGQVESNECRANLFRLYTILPKLTQLRLTVSDVSVNQ